MGISIFNNSEWNILSNYCLCLHGFKVHFFIFFFRPIPGRDIQNPTARYYINEATRLKNCPELLAASAESRTVGRDLSSEDVGKTLGVVLSQKLEGT